MGMGTGMVSWIGALVRVRRLPLIVRRGHIIRLVDILEKTFPTPTIAIPVPVGLAFSVLDAELKREAIPARLFPTSLCKSCRRLDGASSRSVPGVMKARGKMPYLPFAL